MALARWLPAPPLVGDAAANDRAALFHKVAWSTAALVTLLVPIVGIVQPETGWLVLASVAVVDLMVMVTLGLSRAGRTTAASTIFVATLVLLVTFNAPFGGGIRSPGANAYFLFVMLAGLLLGKRAGLTTAVVCLVLGFVLVLMERTGVGPLRPLAYGPVVLWLLSSLYIGIAFVTMRLATGRVERALERVSAELADRRAAEVRLSRALDAGHIGVFDYEIASRSFRGDARALRLTGLTASPDGETTFDDWLDLVHPEDRESVLQVLGRFADGQTHALTRYRLIRPDGQERHLEASAHLTLDAAGAPASVLGMIMDVTERRTAEAERERLVGDLGERVKELRLLHVVARLLQRSSAVDRILLLDLVNRFPTAWLHADDAGARIRFGGDEVISSGWSESKWRQLAPFKTSVGPGSIEVAYRSEHATADEGPFLREERTLIDSLAEMLGSHIERHTVERQRQGLEAQLRQSQKMDALGTLAGGIAHDFNNLLTAIGGNAQLAALTVEKGSPIEGMVHEILTAHKRAGDLVRRILLFSRQEESVRQVISIAPVVTEALELLRASLPPNVEIRAEIPASLPLVSADATQIHQVMMNLATNAGYAMRERGGTLSVAIDAITVADEATAPAAELEPGDYIRFTVGDTGSGISPAVRDRLFEPFFTTKGQAGTGLGLSVVHGIVRDHGGAITVESEVGVGTCFAVYLPATDATARRITPAATVVRGNAEHIMYVDDEASLCLVISRTLAHIGYRCTEFQDVSAALQEFRTAPHSYDAIVTDLQMPAMSGLDFVREIRKIRPDIPVAVASGYAAHDLEDPDAAKVVWISKPSTLVEMSSALRRLVTSAPERGDSGPTARFSPGPHLSDRLLNPRP